MNTHSFKKQLFTVLFSVMLSTAFTQKVLVDSTKQLQEVVVTATRKSTSINSLPYTVSIVQSKDIQQFQSRSMPEALVGVDGLFIQKTNHGGGSPFIRGLTGNQTLLLVDGIRLNNATFRFGPNQYLNTIDVYSIDKVEVARGTGSVQYGSDALGGVIHLLTKDPQLAGKPTFHSKLLTKAISQNMEYTARAEASFQSKKFAVLAGYSHKNFGDLIGGDTTGKQVPSGYKEQAFDVKAKWQIHPQSSIVFAHQWLQQKNVPLYHRVKLENFAYYFFDPQQRQMSYVKWITNFNTPLFNKLTIVGSLQNSLEKRRYQRNANINQFIEEDKIRTWGFTTDIASTISKSWTANSGIEYYHDYVNSIKQQINSNNLSLQNQRGLYPNNATNGNFSIYSLHHFHFKRLEIEAGLRFNTFSIKIPDTITSTLKLGDVQVRPSSLVTNAAVLYRIAAHQSVFASFSTGYRAPNIDDMGTLGLVDFRYEIPAYNLQPEKTYHSEIGYRFTRSKFNTSIAFYYMHLNNLITRVQVPNQQVSGYNVYTKQNSQESYIRGIEISNNVRFTTTFSLKANIAYAYGQNISLNEPMRRIPPFNGRIAMNYQSNKWYASLESLFASKQNRLAQGDKSDNRIPIGGTPSWNVLNTYVGYQISQIAIRASIQNILNEDYRTHGSGINAVGRCIAITTQLQF